jgi:predicted  nucleic acid-binding Zn-ribbon protein
MADKDPNPGHSMFGLNDAPTRRVTAPEEAPASPQPQPAAPQYVLVQQAPQSVPTAGGMKALPWLVAALGVLAIANLVMMLMARSQFNDYKTNQSDAIEAIKARLDSSDHLYAQLSGHFQVVEKKLGMTEEELAHAHALAAEVQKQQQAAVAQLNQAIAQKASADEVNKLQADSNAKIGSLNTDLAGTKQDLASTKSEFANALTNTKGELSGSIARTHDELVALAHKGDRDYFEFSLPRKKAQQKIGTITVELEKTDPKRNVFSFYLIADDKRIYRSNRAMNEPVYLIVNGASSALELVVNKLGKDSVSGYMSTPKGFFPNTTNVLGQRPGA